MAGRPPRDCLVALSNLRAKHSTVRSWTIAWLLGVLALWRLEHLPALPWWALLTVGLMSALPRSRPLLLVGASLCGFAWAGQHAELLLDDRAKWLSSAPSSIVLAGAVEGLPHVDGRRVRFHFRPDGAASLLQLSWYGSQRIPAAGEHLRLELRLKAPRGARNLYGSDYEVWLFRRRVAAVGVVLRGSYDLPREGLRIRNRLDRLRERFAQAVWAAVPQPTSAALLTALAVGDRQALPSATRDLLVRTGTMHLLAISGLHVGLVAGLGFVMVRGLWARIPPLCARCPAIRAGAVAALLAASSYAALAGLSLPTQRALVMTAAVLVAVLASREVSLSRVLALALLGTTLLDPLAPLGVDFWLSFGAVGAIGLLFVRRLGSTSALAAWLKVQLMLPVAMVPLGLALFGSASLVAGPANLVAVPWVSMIAVPLTLLGVLLELVYAGAGNAVWSLSADSLSLLLEFLHYLDRAAFELARPPPSTAAWLAALSGGLLLLGPRGLPGQPLGLILLLAAVLAPPPEGTKLTLALLDSGEDSFVALAHSPGTTLVFGTGRRRGRLDPGQISLPQYLRAQGLGRIDTLVISGPPASRAGGVRSLLQRVPVARVLVGNPLDTPIAGAGRCDEPPADAVGSRSLIKVRARRDHPSRCYALVATPDGGMVVIAPDGWSDLDHLRPDSVRAVVTTPRSLAEIQRRLGTERVLILVAGTLPPEHRTKSSVLQTGVAGDLMLRFGQSAEPDLTTWSERRRRLWHQP
jgi:competence protein ComEC